MRDEQEERCKALSLRVFSVNAGDSGKSLDTPVSPEGSGLRCLEFLGFTAKTLNHNVVHIDYRN
jgi:hypothetical protein